MFTDKEKRFLASPHPAHHMPELKSVEWFVANGMPYAQAARTVQDQLEQRATKLGAAFVEMRKVLSGDELSAKLNAASLW